MPGTLDRVDVDDLVRRIQEDSTPPQDNPTGLRAILIDKPPYFLDINYYCMLIMPDVAAKSRVITGPFTYIECSSLAVYRKDFSFGRLEFKELNEKEKYGFLTYHFNSLPMRFLESTGLAKLMKISSTPTTRLPKKAFGEYPCRTINRKDLDKLCDPIFTAKTREEQNKKAQEFYDWIQSLFGSVRYTYLVKCPPTQLSLEDWELNVFDPFHTWKRRKYWNDPQTLHPIFWRKKERHPDK